MKYAYITNDAELVELLPKLKHLTVGLDIETTGLNVHQDAICLIQLAVEQHHILIINWPELSKKGKNHLRTWFTSQSLLIAHNMKFDLSFLLKAGFKPFPSLILCWLSD